MGTHICEERRFLSYSPLSELTGSSVAKEVIFRENDMQLPKVKLSDIRIDAVIVGAIVDNMTTMSVMLLLMSGLASTGIPQEEAMNRMKSLSGMLLGLIIGLGCTMLGGYVAGRMAKKSELLHGALVAAIGMTLALLFQEKGLPLWYDIAGFLGMLPAGIAGGYLARQRRAPE